MSSTNRSKVRDKHIADYYKTPTYAIEEFLNVFRDIECCFDGKKILDPCAGGDNTTQMSYPKILNKYGFNVDTIDIREDSLADIKGDYLKINCKDKYDVIITNPPFNISLDIIKKAIDDVKDDGYVIMLLRLNYYGSDKRKDFFESIMPKYTFVHRKRMSFTDDGKTDSIEYAHFVFKKGYNEKFSKLYVI